MQAPGTPQAAATQAAQAAEAAAQAQAALAAQTAQNLRDEAQALRNQTQAIRDGVRGGITVQPSDVQLRAMEYEHTRQQEKMVFAGFVIVMVAAVIVLSPLARAFARRMERSRAGKNKLDSDSNEQLERIEQSIDAMAIEIERISEGQRFTTKLLSGREEALIPAGSRDNTKKV